MITAKGIVLENLSPHCYNRAFAFNQFQPYPAVADAGKAITSPLRRCALKRNVRRQGVSFPALMGSHTELQGLGAAWAGDRCHQRSARPRTAGDRFFVLFWARFEPPILKEGFPNEDLS